jgi:hypothetical protein
MPRLYRLPGTHYYQEFRLSLARLSFRVDDTTSMFGVTGKLLHVTLHLEAERCCGQFGLSAATKCRVLL